MGEIKKFYVEFYKNKLKIREIYENIQRMGGQHKTEQQMVYNLVDDYEKIFLDTSKPIEIIFNAFRNNYNLLLNLVEVLEKNKQYKEDIDSIVELFTHHFFENHLIQNSDFDEILIFIYQLLQREINKMSSTTSIQEFLPNDHSIVGKILKSYTKKPEVKAFVALILNNTILKIENSADQLFLEMDPKKYNKNKKEYLNTY